MKKTVLYLSVIPFIIFISIISLFGNANQKTSDDLLLGIETFEYRYSGYGGPSGDYNIDFISNTANYTNVSSDGSMTSYVEISFSDKDEEMILKVFGDSLVPHWEDRYEELEACDGTQWHIDIKYKDVSQSVYGSNKEPKKFDEVIFVVTELFS